MSSKKKSSTSKNNNNNNNNSKTKNQRQFETFSVAHPNQTPAFETGDDMLDFDPEDFAKNVTINILDRDPKEHRLDFEIVGISPPIANAIRRVLIAEIPTLAFERVFISDNTSVIQDEVLAHRIGMIPLNYDCSGWFENITEEDIKIDNFNQNNTATFKLNVKCVPNPDPHAKNKYLHEKVYSRDIVWEPVAQQAEHFREKPLAPLMGDILIAKLRPGQEINMEIFAHLGVGSDHAKFSPVATAFYRLKPDPIFLETVSGADAEKLKKTCPVNVFDIENAHAVIKNPANCTVCRECIRHPEFEKKIELRRAKNHFLFTIESVGAIEPDQLFLKAIQILAEKADRLQKALEKH